MAFDWSMLPIDACCLRLEPPTGVRNLREVLLCIRANTVQISPLVGVGLALTLGQATAPIGPLWGRVAATRLVLGHLSQSVLVLGLQNALGDEFGLTLDLSYVVGTISVAGSLHLSNNLIQGSYKLGSDNLTLGFQQLSGAVWVGGL